MPRRGEVWLAELDKVRPVVVMTRDPMGTLLSSVIVAPVTSTVRGISTEVPVGPQDGIRHPSVANLDNVALLARSRLRRKVGRARPSTMQAMCDALAAAVDCGAATPATTVAGEAERSGDPGE
ncbi:MAG: type II toxin-antitoxin system PemK/MazF family toxin [Acidimicrobiales bacterium]